MTENETLISNTRKWIEHVVIACNFCPFAAKEVKQGTIRYQVGSADTIANALIAFSSECQSLDQHPDIETTLLILPIGFDGFDHYLELVAQAEEQLHTEGYEGIYQLASFHPLYCFEGARETDAANFTNKSPYPMLHLLREESVERAIARYPNAHGIPDKNIDFARKKGSAYMKTLRDACL
ncbi:MAG TPA: DUF1415 domain-containing protein [Chitinophagales bacterium]|nr:DUF1415 domain-containing protein [Chitinophagales bacterium]